MVGEMRLLGMRVYHKVIADIRMSSHEQHHYYLLVAEFQKSE